MIVQNAQRQAADYLDALPELPLCPTCSGKRHAMNGSVTNAIDPCPDCVDGHVSWQRCVNVFSAVHGDRFDDLSWEQMGAVDFLRTVR